MRNMVNLELEQTVGATLNRRVDELVIVAGAEDRMRMIFTSHRGEARRHLPARCGYDGELEALCCTSLNVHEERGAI